MLNAQNQDWDCWKNMDDSIMPSLICGWLSHGLIEFKSHAKWLLVLSISKVMGLHCL